MISVHWYKNNKLETGNASLIKEWQSTPDGHIWIDIESEDPYNEAQLLTELGCHELAIQDAQRDRHPPKIEHFKSNSFLLYRGIQSIEPGLNINMLQVSIFFSDNYVVTLHKRESLEIKRVVKCDELGELVCSPIKLLCSILNNAAILYTNVILNVEEALEDLEEQMSSQGSDELLMDVLSYRTKLRKFRRIFSYHEKICQVLLRESSLLPGSDTGIVHSIQDVYDKFERLHSLSTLYYDLCGDLSDGYLSVTSHQLNKTMQVLTVITAIFIPLGFLAGIYGMNFENMPELHFKYGYQFLLLFMTSLAISLFVIFKKKHWL